MTKQPGMQCPDMATAKEFSHKPKGGYRKQKPSH